MSLGALLTTGCAETVNVDDPRPESERQTGPMPLNDEVFVDAQRFQELRTDQNATVIDARTEAEYDEGHLPGAIHSGNKSGGYKPFKNPDDNDVLHRDVVKLQNVARDLGVSRDRPVLLYGNPASKRVGRLYWTLEHLGHGEVYAHTPGYENLLDELDVTASTEEPNADRGDFVVSRRESVLATNEEVRAVAEGEQNGILIDTRRETEYTGEEDRGDPRQGYIPDAVHYHWEQMFTDQGALQPLDELEQEFRDRGFWEPDTVLIPYCQTGTRSAYVYAVLRELDSYQQTPKNYDGSWVKWARNEGYPVDQHEESSSDS